jgi:ribonuclease III
MDEQRRAALKELARAINYDGIKLNLLEEALTHRSYANENPSAAIRDNERLEFLGDAVVELCVSDAIMRHFPDYKEGQMSKLRASIVHERPLASLAARFRLGDYLLLGKGEESSGGRDKPSLLADAFEAVIAAIYLDGGFEKVHQLLWEMFEPLIVDADGSDIYRDHKTTLQEISQTRFREIPHYTIIGEFGPDHDKTFIIQMEIPNSIKTTGSGKNKKEAEQEAAREALAILEARADQTTMDGS